MFSKRDVSVFGWFVFMFISAIPLLNILFWVILLLSGSTNKTLKNFLLMYVVVLVLFVVLVFGLGLGAGILNQIADQLPA